MRTFFGCLIRESLHTCDALPETMPIFTRVAHVPNDPDATSWHVCWYHIAKDQLCARLPALASAMRRNWYGHFWSGDDLIVILPGRIFWAKASDRSTWEEFIRYGETVGVGRKWTERIPTELPTYAGPT